MIFSFVYFSVYCMPSTMLSDRDLKMMKHELSLFREVLGKNCLTMFLCHLGLDQSGTNKMFSFLQNKQFQLEAISWN